MVHLLGAGVVVRNVDVQRVLAFLQSQHERVCDWRVGLSFSFRTRFAPMAPAAEPDAAVNPTAPLALRQLRKWQFAVTDTAFASAHRFRVVGMQQIQQVAGVLCQHGPIVLGEARAV